MDKRCGKCSIKKDYETHGFVACGALAQCMSCQKLGNYLYSKDEPKGCRGNVKIDLSEIPTEILEKALEIKEKQNATR